ncbi:DNA internalization-related competence protein ComEC/Rec2 [Aliikangiella marina]|uniref:DNA internalization-related competence protein ComEC/Rec2 n=1 Tax=Aliikangiella marina TaxID=1712262 RepID=A0A545TJ92_9GAMM|nr:DNA internalization-related competence protein ComEC/Rec2 [Aliikangiella marina]TQV77299.1 DNA internalization-related competence protein ComEC/Rec2 [Aliikangiella marina]
MFFYGMGFLLGCTSLWFIDSQGQALLLLSASLATFVFCYVRRFTNRLFIAFLLGLLWSSLNIVIWAEQTQAIVERPKSSKLTGYICSIPVYQIESWQFDFCAKTIDSEPLSHLSRNRVKVRWGKYAVDPSTTPKAGQFWRFNVKLRPVHSKLNPASFDYERWLISNGFIATASVKTEASLMEGTSLASRFHRWRQSVFEHLEGVLPQSPQRPLMLALLLGERNEISPSQWQLLQQTGTSHLLAISGLHVGIASLWSYWIINFLWKRSATLCRMLPAYQAAQIASLCGAIMVVLLSGMGLPAQRALLMLLLFIGARQTGIYLSLSSTIGLALIGILILDPFAPLATSFWLSFGAVLVIAIVVNRSISPRNKLWSWLSVNWYLYLAMIPIGLLFFEVISWVALIANILLIPLTSFATTPLLYIGGMLSIFSEQFAKFIFVLADYLLILTTWVQSKTAQLNPKSLSFVFNSVVLMIFFVLLLVSAFPKKSLSKSPLFAGLVIILLYQNKPSIPPKFEMWVFDIGQGLAIFVNTAQGSLLYDTGWGNSAHATAQSSVIPYLNKMRINTINRLVVSHGDADHAGGLGAILNSLDTQTIISGEPLDSYSSENCHHKRPWQWGDVKFKFLQHNPNNQWQGNNSSCVLSITVNGFRILLPGDIEKSAENRLIARGIEAYDVVIAPHHGSKTSSTWWFVRHTSPKHVIFSTGYDNQWGFPKQSVVERYLQARSKVWITHRDGAIKVTIDQAGGLEVSSMREEHPHFWR